jgi:hypothetical protein
MPLERDAHRVILVSWENCLHIESRCGLGKSPPALTLM